MQPLSLTLGVLALLRADHSPPWPGYPGPQWGPSPPKHGDDELPLTSGMVVNIQSHTLQTFCNVGPADATPFPSPLRCLSSDEIPDSASYSHLGQHRSRRLTRRVRLCCRRCLENTTSLVSGGLLIVGKDFTDSKV